MKNSQFLSAFRISPQLTLFLIFLLGLGLRLYKLDFQSFWLDEFYNIHLAQQPGIIFGGIHNVPPLYINLLKVWLWIFPISETNVRLLGALFGSASIFAIYHLAKMLISSKGALWAAFFLAISAIHVDYSQEAKYYSLALLLTMMMQLYYLRILQYQKKSDFFWFIVFSTLAFYTFYYLVLVFCIQVTHLVFNRKVLKRVIPKIIFSQAISLLAFLPCIFYMLRDPKVAAGSLGWLPQLSSKVVWETTLSLFSDNFVKTPYGNLITWDSRLPDLWYFAFFALLIYLLFYYRKQNRESFVHFSFIALWTVLPTALVLGWSIVAFNIYHNRYVLITILGLYLLYSWLLNCEKREILRAVLVGFIVFTHVANLLFYFHYPVRHQFREAAYFISQDCNDNDVILVKGYKHEQSVFNYYFRKSGRQNNVKFSERKQEHDPNQHDWIVAVYPAEVDTERYSFSVKYFYGIRVYKHH